MTLVAEHYKLLTGLDIKYLTRRLWNRDLAALVNFHIAEQVLPSRWSRESRTSSIKSRKPIDGHTERFSERRGML